MSLDPYHCYYIYNAMRLHFTSKYDAIKYKFKTSANEKAYWKRRDKYFFGKIGRRFKTTQQLLDYYIAHMSKGNTWVGDMLEKEEVYTEWCKFNQSLGYNFKSQLDKLSFDIEKFDDLIKHQSPYPLLIEKYIGGEVRLETVVIINKLTGFVADVDKEITDTIMWPDIKTLINNYDPFLEVDLDKTKQIVLDTFTQ